MMALGRETERKAFHLSAGILIAFLVYFGFVNAWHLAAAALVGLMVSLAYRRKRIPVVGWFLRRMERDDAIASFPGRGAFFFLCGALLSAAIFPRDIAAASIMVLAVCDSVVPLVGRRRPGPFWRNGSKRPAGAVTLGFFLSLFGAWAFIPLTEAFLAAAAGTAVETVDTFRGRRIEDNLTIPLAAGAAAFALRVLFLA